MEEETESPQLGKRGKKVVTAICKVIGSKSASGCELKCDLSFSEEECSSQRAKSLSEFLFLFGKDALYFSVVPVLGLLFDA